MNKDYYEHGDNRRYCEIKAAITQCTYCSNDSCLLNLFMAKDFSKNQKDVYNSIIAKYPEPDFWAMVEEDKDYYEIHV